MLLELDQKITDLQKKINEKNIYQRKLDDAQLEYKEINQEVVDLKKKLDKEELDVKKLESISLVSLWSSLMGNKNVKLNEEKQEAAKAQSDYKFASNTRERLLDEMKNIKSHIHKIELDERKLNELIKEKEQLILDSDNELGTQLDELNNEIINKNKYLVEIKEALSAGRQLKVSLDHIKEVLNKAKGWGTWDLFGGGLLADVMKHSHLDDAERSIQNLRYVSKKFSRELKDVNLNLNIEINIGSMLRFADYFFDGFFSDYAVQSKINDAIDQTYNQQQKVSSVINKLHSEQKKYNDQVSELEEQKKKLLLPQ